jgi:SAM-dependent methyltransferase
MHEPLRKADRGSSRPPRSASGETSVRDRIDGLTQERAIAQLAARYRASQNGRLEALLSSRRAVRAELLVLDDAIGAARDEPAVNGHANGGASRADLDAALAVAADNAPIGVRMPSFERYPRGLRPLARAVGRAVFFVSRHITGPQRTVNDAVLRNLRWLYGRSQEAAACDSDLRRAAAAALERQIEGELEAADADFRLYELEVRVARLRADQLGPVPDRLDTLEEAVRQLSRQLAASKPAGDGIDTDTFYAEFEDRFRGSPQIVTERLRAYLPDLTDAGVGGPARPVLDLGCGRGEWLVLLDEAGHTARGVDANRTIAERLQRRGLDVVHAEALTCLRELASSSVGAITAFHLIEHLPPDHLMSLVREAHRVLADGGLLLLETPNAENLRVGAHFFWSDPTHVRPVVSEHLEFLVRHCGFRHVEIRRLAEHRPFAGGMAAPLAEAPWAADVGRIVEHLNRYLFSAPDYCVLARKPADARAPAAVGAPG